MVQSMRMWWTHMLHNHGDDKRRGELIAVWAGMWLKNFVGHFVVHLQQEYLPAGL